VDPQLGDKPAASTLAVVERKDINKTDDETLIFADVSRKAINQVRDVVITLLQRGGLPTIRVEKLAHALADGQWTHDYPITAAQARDLGLPVSTEIPDEVRGDHPPVSAAARTPPVVEYVPIPYRPSPGGGSGPKSN
jgi:hypothetical protein